MATVWHQWVDTGTSSSTPTWGQWQGYVTGSASTNAWLTWQGNSTITASTLDTWVVWSGQSATTTTITRRYAPPAPVTPEEQARRDAARAEADKQARERAEQQRVAVQRAHALLESVLTEEQREELAKSAHFHVRGSRGRRYRILARGQSGNVVLVDENGVKLARFCCHPDGVPDPDAWIAQKLALETDEDAFMRVTNVMEGGRPELVAA